jgi:hypothetical protein
MLYLRDLLPAGKRVKIEYRCNSPKYWQDEEEDMLFGYAIWTGEELVSGDGDNYYLGDVVEKYEWLYEDHLTIWIEVLWNSERKEAPADD